MKARTVLASFDYIKDVDSGENFVIEANGYNSGFNGGMSLDPGLRGRLQAAVLAEAVPCYNTWREENNFGDKADHMEDVLQDLKPESHRVGLGNIEYVMQDMAQRHARLILKPAQGAHGHGIEVLTSDSPHSLDRALSVLRMGKPHILQAFVQAEPMLDPESGEQRLWSGRYLGFYAFRQGEPVRIVFAAAYRRMSTQAFCGEPNNDNAVVNLTGVHSAIPRPESADAIPDLDAIGLAIVNRAIVKTLIRDEVALAMAPAGFHMPPEPYLWRDGVQSCFQKTFDCDCFHVRLPRQFCRQREEGEVCMSNWLTLDRKRTILRSALPDLPGF